MKWFKHDADANRDPKLEKVLMKYGAEGYALYWLCIELIVHAIDRRNITFELEHDCEILAHRLRMDSVRVEEILRCMVDLGLFEVNPSTQFITCMKIATRLENSIVKSPELKQIQALITGQEMKSGKISDDPGTVGTDKKRLDIDVDIEQEGYPPELNVEAWERYFEHRRDIRAKKLTDKGMAAAIKTWCKSSHEAQTLAVKNSVENGYIGCWPAKHEPRSTSKPSYAENLASEMTEKGML